MKRLVVNIIVQTCVYLFYSFLTFSGLLVQFSFGSNGSSSSRANSWCVLAASNYWEELFGLFLETHRKTK